MSNPAVIAALSTRDRMRDSDLKGWDPYDTLTSPLFKLPLFRSSWLLRFGIQQVVLRAPINLRPLLRTPKQRNAVTVGLYIQGLSDLTDAGLLDRSEAAAEVSRWIANLKETRSPGWSGSCWGYPFPWEGRPGAHRTPAGFPTVVATGMICNGLHRAWQVFNDRSAQELLLDSAAFVLNDLNRVDETDDAWCWSYSPADQQAVVNATMKGTRLIAQAIDAGLDDANAMEAAASSARWTARQQKENGGWAYAVGDDPRSWEDHFHTAYILECFSTYRNLSGDRSFDETVQRGWDHYREVFFTDSAIPRYYDTQDAPLDPTAAGQALLILPDFGEAEYATEVLAAVMPKLGNPDGSFRYRPRGARGRAGGVHYIRWSTAWMFAGMAHVLNALKAAEPGPNS